MIGFLSDAVFSSPAGRVVELSRRSLGQSKLRKKTKIIGSKLRKKETSVVILKIGLITFFLGVVLLLRRRRFHPPHLMIFLVS